MKRKYHFVLAMVIEEQNFPSDNDNGGLEETEITQLDVPLPETFADTEE